MQLKQNEVKNSLKISENAINTIIEKTVKEIEGVNSLTNKPLTLARAILRSKPNKPFKIYLNQDVAIIDVYVNLNYGFNIKTVAGEIQNNVKEAIQNMTHITVSKVNVHILDIVEK